MFNKLKPMKMKTDKSLNILLVGKTGNGLSAIGNSILDKQVFKSVYNSSLPTEKITSGHGEYKKFRIQVDVREIFDHVLNNIEVNIEKVRIEGENCFSHHAIVFVMKFGDQLLGEEEKILENLENIFGKNIYNHMIVVMIRGEEFHSTMEEEEGYSNFQECCSQQEGRFQKLYKDCDRRIVLLDNRDKTGNKRKQTREILNLAIKMKVGQGSLQVHDSNKTKQKLKFCFRGNESRTHLVKCCRPCLMMLYLLMMMIEWSHSTSSTRLLCHPGTYVHTTRNNKYICLPCPDGTFMPHSLHTHKTCYNCTQIRDHNLEVIKTECSRTRDAEILCIPGYYRRRFGNVREGDRCEKCYECEHPTLSCQDYHDMVCCGHTNYDAVLNKDGVYECKERPIFCDPGQFLNPETEECTPCPPGTFMSEVQHDKTVCRPCKTVSGLGAHETILQACSSTQQANIGCEDGYFRNSSGNLWDEMQCLPCQKCEYQGRECDMYHDTVCCDYPDMIVVNTSSGYLCNRSGSSTVEFSETDNNNNYNSNKETNKQECGENEYLYFISEISVECVPCGRGTYMDKSSHKEKVCKNVSQSNNTHAPGNSNIEDTDKNVTMWVTILCMSNGTCLIIIIVMLLYILKLRRRLVKNLQG